MSASRKPSSREPHTSCMYGYFPRTWPQSRGWQMVAQQSLVTPGSRQALVPAVINTEKTWARQPSTDITFFGDRRFSRILALKRSRFPHKKGDSGRSKGHMEVGISPDHQQQSQVPHYSLEAKEEPRRAEAGLEIGIKLRGMNSGMVPWLPKSIYKDLSLEMIQNALWYNDATWYKWPKKVLYPPKNFLITLLLFSYHCYSYYSYHYIVNFFVFYYDLGSVSTT